MIEWYGRKDINGILLNLTDGGEGFSGLIITEEIKNKISNTMKGKSNFQGKKHTAEGKKNISAGRGNYDPIKGKKWYTNTITGKSVRAYCVPSEEYVEGRVLVKQCC
jgi:hypothetical protein